MDIRPVYVTTEFTINLFTYMILLVGIKKSNIVQNIVFIFTNLEQIF